jgi:uncharacterized protein YidB (DUF937 family)
MISTDRIDYEPFRKAEINLKGLHPKKVIVTSLTLALLLGGSALYTTRQQVSAETADLSAQQTAQTDANKQLAKKTKDHRDGFKNGSMPLIEEASVLLGLDKSTLEAALKDRSLVEIAKDKGISEADLISKLQAERSKKLDEAVQAGKIKSEYAEKMKGKMAEHLKFLVNQKGEGLDEGKRSKPFRHHAGMPAPDKLSAIIGITTEELETQLKAGKSLTEIAQSHGMSKEQLIVKIKEHITPWIEKIVDRKAGSADTSVKSGSE